MTPMAGYSGNAPGQRIRPCPQSSVYTSPHGARRKRRLPNRSLDYVCSSNPGCPVYLLSKVNRAVRLLPLAQAAAFPIQLVPNFLYLRLQMVQFVPVSDVGEERPCACSEQEDRNYEPRISHFALLYLKTDLRWQLLTICSEIRTGRLWLIGILSLVRLGRAWNGGTNFRF